MEYNRYVPDKAFWGKNDKDKLQNLPLVGDEHWNLRGENQSIFNWNELSGAAS